MVKTRAQISVQEENRIKVKTLLQVHKTPNQILKDIGVVRQTVYNTKKRKRVQRKKGSGSPNILDKKQKLQIIQTIKHNPFLSAPDLKNQLELTCCSKTISNYLKQSGFIRRKPDRKPRLTAQQKQDRVEWCERYRTFRYWGRVIFTDESGFWLFDNNKQGWFKSGFSDPMEIESHPGKVNVWAAISAKGKVSIHVYRENLRSNNYIDILNDYLIPNADELYPNRWEFQHDKQ